MTRVEKKEELIGLFSTGAIFIGDLIDECFEFGQHHPHWISVEDELPKEGDAILAMQDIHGNHWFTACQFIKADVRRGIVDFFVKSDAHIGISVDGKVTLGHVSHWMPRPAPPEHLAGVSKKISGSSEFPNNCQKFGMKGYENVIIHEGNAKGYILKGGEQ